MRFASGWREVVLSFSGSLKMGGFSESRSLSSLEGISTSEATNESSWKAKAGGESNRGRRLKISSAEKSGLENLRSSSFESSLVSSNWTVAKS